MSVDYVLPKLRRGLQSSKWHHLYDNLKCLDGRLASWNLVPQTAAAILPVIAWLLQREKQEGATEEEIFENERYIPIRGWSSSLLPTERRRYSTRDGSQSFNDFPMMHLPSGLDLPKTFTGRKAFISCTGLVMDNSLGLKLQRDLWIPPTHASAV